MAHSPTAVALHNAADVLAGLRRYYDETWLDYRLLWLDQSNYAIHFGYWDEETRSHSDSLTNLNAVLAKRIGIQPGMRVLDAGCGVGGGAVWLARNCDVEVVGITPVPSQVERAQLYARAQGVGGQVRFEQQDYTCTSFPTASFDVVWAVESVCHAPDKSLFFREARRLLRDGGRLGITEYIRYRRQNEPAGQALLRSWLSGWAIPEIATGHELLTWAGHAGFGEIRMSDITPNVEPSLRRLFRLATAAWIAALLLRAIGVRSHAQQGNVRGARDQYRALLSGLWFYGLFTATAHGPRPLMD